MRRKPVQKLLERIGRQRTRLGSSRERIVDRLAARPTAPRGAARADGLVLDHLDAELATVESTVAAAEDAYVLASRRVTELREERDTATGYLRELYRPIPSLLGGLPLRGAPVLAVNPGSPAALAHHIPKAIEVLRDLDRDSPPRLIGLRIDTGVLADELETALAPLEAAFRAVDDASAELKLARARAHRAFEPAPPVVKWVSTALDGLRSLADS